MYFSALLNKKEHNIKIQDNLYPIMFTIENQMTTIKST